MKGLTMKTALALLLLCLPRLALAAGSVSFSTQQINQGGTAYMVTINWQGDASTGTVPTTTITGLNQVQGYTITQIQTVPGTPAPTAGYSITVKDVNGYDMAGGQASSLSATASASFATTSATPPVVGSLSFALTGNSVASAKGKVILYIYKPSVLAAANLLGRYGSGSGSGITDLTGDVTATGPGSAAATLATVNSNTGSCGDATHVCQVTLDAKGRATAASAVAISGGGSGTVTVVGSGSLTNTALVTGGGTTTLQTPAATATMDSSGNISTPGTFSAGVGSGNAGADDLGAGTVQTVPANSFGWGAGSAMTTSVRLESPNAVPGANTIMLFGAPDVNHHATWTYAAPITLTTTGSSGAATYTQATNTLNIPQYSGGGGAVAHSERIPLVGCDSGGTGRPLVDVVANVTANCNGGSGLPAFLGFANSTSDKIGFIFDLPSTWAGNLTLTFTYWSSANITGTPALSLRMGCVGNGDPNGYTFNGATTVNLGSAGTVTADTTYVTTSGNLTTTGCAANKSAAFEVSRGDTNTGTLRVRGITLNITY